MTTIEMARASHLDVYGLGKDREKFVAVIERFAEIARAEEREACAKVAEELRPGLSSTRVAEIIRARSNT